MNVLLHLADPGLRGTSGHHMAAIECLSDVFGADRLVCDGYRDADEDLLRLLAERKVHFRSHFTTYLYDAYNVDWTIADAQPYIHKLAADYGRLIDDIAGSGEATAVIHHTVDWPHILALASALAGRKHLPDRAVHFVFLMFDPGVGWHGEVLSNRRYLNYRVALAILSQQSGIRVFTSCLDYYSVYRSAFKLPLEIGLHPCFFFNAPSVREHVLPEPDVKRVVLYMGDAKAEKGFLQLADLAQVFLSQISADSEILVHYNLDGRLASAQLRRVSEALDMVSRQDKRLKVLKGYMAESSLTALLRVSSYVVFNYNAAAYANKTSGALWLACCIGVPVVVIGDSWLSREAQRIGRHLRVFPTIRALERELKKFGDLRVRNTHLCEGYCQLLFQPLADFIMENLPETRAPVPLLVLPKVDGEERNSQRSHGGSRLRPDPIQ